MRETAEELLKTEQRVEDMYINELGLHGLKYDGGVECKILNALHACFVVRYPPEQVREFFAPFARGEKEKGVAQPPKNAHPRSVLTNKQVFVRAFFESGQTKYSFAKRVARINAALPKGHRFGCNSTTLDDVETQLDRALEQWGDIVREQMSRGQK